MDNQENPQKVVPFYAMGVTYNTAPRNHSTEAVIRKAIKAQKINQTFSGRCAAAIIGGYTSGLATCLTALVASSQNIAYVGLSLLAVGTSGVIGAITGNRLDKKVQKAEALAESRQIHKPEIYDLAVDAINSQQDWLASNFVDEKLNITAKLADLTSDESFRKQGKTFNPLLN